ncbi:Response regulator rcp1 [Planctomycetaceae bacterium]|nr:Response regulator rcp1 [Planctomycetaceae bacterium]
MVGVSVLLVEDNPDEEFLTLRVLKKFPSLARIDVVRDGEEAVEYLATGATLPDLVLLDLKLPKIDGIDVLADFRSREESRDTAVVVLSSSDYARDISRCLELGADAYLLKPLNAKEFESVLGRHGFSTARAQG